MGRRESERWRERENKKGEGKKERKARITIFHGIGDVKLLKLRSFNIQIFDEQGMIKLNINFGSSLFRGSTAVMRII